MSGTTIGDRDSGGIDPDDLAKRLEPTFEAILDDVYGRAAAIARVEALLAKLPQQFLSAIDEAGFDLVRRTEPSR